jgi:glutamate-1-semialdehyde 2,1-aminomutase
MDMVAPLGPVYQAGTLSGNPLAMAAGLAMLCHLRDNPGVYARMEKLAASLVAGVGQAAHEAGVALTWNRVGSMFTWFFTHYEVSNWSLAAKCDTKAFGKYFRSMLDAGIYLPPSQFEAAFFSTAHTEQDVEATIAAAREAFALVRA